MGLMTAYHAAPLAESVTVLDRSRVGDPATASFGLTRSVRNDYRDPEYARLAFEARRLWRDFERDCGRRLLVGCGCLNLVKGTVTPDLASSYAVESYAVLEQLRLRREAFSGAQLRDRFPQFDADGGWLDVDAGFADLAAVTQALREGLDARGVRVVENTEPRGITRSDGTWIVATDNGPVESDVLVVTAGLGTNDVLGLVPGCPVRFPLRPDRPVQSKYFIPQAGSRAMFTLHARQVRRGRGGFMSLSIVGRLRAGTVLGAEGYVFELERRGYIKAGPFVPEVVLDFPEAVRELHREFLRAGADVMVALTYYAHREKLRDVGREGDLEAMNRQAVRIARPDDGDPAVTRRRAGFPHRTQPLRLHALRDGALRAAGPWARCGLRGHLLRRRPASR